MLFCIKMHYFVCSTRYKRRSFEECLCCPFLCNKSLQAPKQTRRTIQMRFQSCCGGGEGYKMLIKQLFFIYLFIFEPKKKVWDSMTIMQISFKMLENWSLRGANTKAKLISVWKTARTQCGFECQVYRLPIHYFHAWRKEIND